MLQITINNCKSLPWSHTIYSGELFPLIPWEDVSEIKVNGVEKTILYQKFPNIIIYTGESVIAPGEFGQFLAANLGGQIFS